jgi:YrbI family 3-deoxy-D-manno-octulosonate 8-phosphate phosphatase
MTECVAIIPARGGSKGISRKNLLPIAGRPLISYVLGEALAAKRVARVVVSTDDAEIAAVARGAGAGVIERPAEISGDAASSESALTHALSVLEKRDGYRPDVMVMLQCTSPLTLAEDIDGAVKTMLDENGDSCFSASSFFHFLWRREAGGSAAGIGHDATRRLRRQDMEPRYLENGAIYVMRTEGFRKSQFRFFGKTVIHAMPAERHLEIDDPADVALAALRLRDRDHAKRGEALPRRIGALIFDFDGVLTDNRVLVGEDGREAVMCDRSDGLGIEMLRRRGLRMTVISKEVNPVVAARCRKLQLECMHGVDDKLPLMHAWLGKHGIPVEEAVYVGNDVNDLGCLAAAACGVVPADAHPDVLDAANIVLAQPGGRGAVRELCDLIAHGQDTGRIAITSK